jgi:hypothetical protein
MQTNSNDLIWGTYGKGGVEHCAGRCPLHPLQWVKLVDRETSHLQAILRTQRQIVGTHYQRGIEAILRKRGETPEKFSYEAEQELFRKMSAADARFRAEQRQKSL